MASRFSLLTAFIAITAVALLCAIYPSGLVPYIVNIGKLVAFAIVLTNVVLKGKQAIFSIGFCAWFVGRFVTRDSAIVNYSAISAMLPNYSYSAGPDFNSMISMQMYEDIFNLLLGCVIGWLCMFIFARKTASEFAGDNLEIDHDDLPPAP